MDDVTPVSVTGPMTSGKSELLTMAKSLLFEHGIPCILAVSGVVGRSYIQTRSTQVLVQQILVDFIVSQIEANTTWQQEFRTSLTSAVGNTKSGRAVVMVDEAQFFTEGQIQVFYAIAQQVAELHGAKVRIVFCGLERDSDGRPFPGTTAAHEIPKCHKFGLQAACSLCGASASETGRYDAITGERLLNQVSVAVDGTRGITYTPTCIDCFEKDLPPLNLLLIQLGLHPGLVAKYGRSLVLVNEILGRMPIPERTSLLNQALSLSSARQ
jgi:thymidine kinase